MKVLYIDTLVELKGIREEDVEYEGSWTLKDLRTFLCETYDFWWKSLRRGDKPVFAVNDKNCAEDHPIKDGDKVYIFNEIKNDLIGVFEGRGWSVDLDRRKYEHIAAVQENEDIVSIPEIVLPPFKKLSTEKAPDFWHHEHYAEHLAKHHCRRNHERVYKYVGRSRKVPEAEFYADISRFHEVWQKLNDDLVRALCDGLHIVNIAHGDSYDPLKQNIRHWLIGCEWVLAYVETYNYNDSGKSVNVELKRLNDDLIQYW